MAKRYRKRPIIIEAMQWTGANSDEIRSWMVEDVDGKEWFTTNDDAAHTAQLFVAANHAWLTIEQGEWVAKDSEGYYPIKEPVFARTYEELNDDDVPVGDLKMSP